MVTQPYRPFRIADNLYYVGTYDLVLHLKFICLNLNKKLWKLLLLKNEANNHRFMQINLDMLISDEEQLEDVYDIIAVELRKNEETVP